MRKILDSMLFVGMKMSRLRRAEEERKLSRLTDAVRLRFPVQLHADTELLITVCPSTAKQISQAMVRSFDSLKDILGDFLFDGMSRSNLRKEELEQMNYAETKALRITSSAGGTEDVCLEIVLDFETGTILSQEIFPS